MRFTVQAKELRAALTKLGALPGVKNTLPSCWALVIEADEFGGLHLSRVTTEACARVACPADVIEGGKGTIGIDAITAMVGRLGVQPIEFFEKKRGILEAAAGLAACTFAKWPDGEVKTFDLEATTVFTAEAENLKRWLKVTSIAAHTETAFENLCGVCFREFDQELKLFGVDKRRVHCCTTGEFTGHLNTARNDAGEDLGWDYGVMLPTDAIASIIKLIAGDKGKAEVSIGKRGVSISTETIEASFLASVNSPPDIRIFMPNTKAEASFECSRAELIRVMKIAAPVGHGDAHVVRIESFGDDRIDISADDHKGTTFLESIPAIVTKPTVYTFNGEYVLDLLDSCTFEKIEVDYISRFRAIRIVNDDTYLFLTGIV